MRGRDLERAVTDGNPRSSLGYAHVDHTLLALCHLPNPMIDPRSGTPYYKPRTW